MDELKLTVLGLGNTLNADDGIGVKLIYALQDLSEYSNTDIEFIDAGVGGLRLLNLLEDTPALLAIDSASMGIEPGESKLILPEQISLEDANFSLHDIGFAQTIFLSEKFFTRPATCIYAIQPARIEQSETLSYELADKFDSLIEKTKTYLDNWNKNKNIFQKYILEEDINLKDRILYNCLINSIKEF